THTLNTHLSFTVSLTHTQTHTHRLGADRQTLTHKRKRGQKKSLICHLVAFCSDKTAGHWTFSIVVLTASEGFCVFFNFLFSLLTLFFSSFLFLSSSYHYIYFCSRHT